MLLTGNVVIKDVVIRDNKAGLICTVGTLAVNASKTCDKTTTAIEGAYSNIGVVIGDFNGKEISRTDVTNYVGGVKPAPSLSIDTRTNGSDGPTIDFGEPVKWTYGKKHRKCSDI